MADAGSKFSRLQTYILEQTYKFSPYVYRTLRLRLSNDLTLTERQIKIWFQNRRMRAKREEPFIRPRNRFVMPSFNRIQLPAQPPQPDYQHPAGARPDWWRCKVCLYEDTAAPRTAIIPCGHVLCAECVDALVQGNNRCTECGVIIERTFNIYE